jgi:hypothetical protein
MLMGIKFIFLFLLGSECTTFIKEFYYKLRLAQGLNFWTVIASSLNSAT